MAAAVQKLWKFSVYKFCEEGRGKGGMQETCRVSFMIFVNVKSHGRNFSGIFAHKHMCCAIFHKTHNLSTNTCEILASYPYISKYLPSMYKCEHSNVNGKSK